MIQINMPDEDSIRARTSDLVFTRGVDHMEDGAVTSLVLRGEYLHAEVDDNALRPFRVEIRLQGETILWTRCSCGFQEAGDCRHVVSALITCARCPEDVQHKPSIEDQLALLSSEALRELWVELVEQKTNTIEWLEAHIPLVVDVVAEDDVATAVPVAEEVGFFVPTTPPPFSLKPPRKKVDPESVRWQVNATIHSLDRMRKEDALAHIPELLNDLRKVLNQTHDYLEAKDPHSALLMLEAMIDVWSEEWEILEEESGASIDFWQELELPLVESLLSVTLSETERDEWYGLIDAWQDEVASYEMDIFGLALAALEEGWDDEALNAILDGSAEKGKDKDETFGSYDWHDDIEELAALRLSVLDRLGNHEGYLRLAWAAGLLPHWCYMLVKLERKDEILADAVPRITNPADALAIVEQLQEASLQEDALQVVMATKQLKGKARPKLLTLGRDLAIALAQPDKAFSLGIEAFHSETTLASYLTLEAHAGDAWAQHQPAILQSIVEEPEPVEECIAILLHEHMLDEAIQLANASDEEAVVAQVVDKLWARRPGWALDACKAQIEPILEQGQSHRYGSVLVWLRKACDAAEAHTTLRDFSEYVEQLLDIHSRKHKLTPLLRELLVDVKKLLKRGRKSTRVLLAMKGKEASELTAAELQQLQLDDQGLDDDGYDAFLEGLSPQAMEFLKLLEQNGYLQAGEAKESLGLESDRQIGGLVGSIKRRANKCYLQPPYMTGLTDAGERFWRWIGRPQSLTQ